MLRHDGQIDCRENGLVLLLTQPNVPIKSIHFNVERLDFVGSEVVTLLSLPPTVTAVSIMVRGDTAQYCLLLSILDRLPDLQSLALHFDTEDDSAILAFPKLVQNLRTATIYWPQGADIIRADNQIESLQLVMIEDSVVILADKTELGDVLRRIQKLEWLQLYDFPTSALANLSMPRGLSHISAYRTMWDLDEAARQALAVREDMRITFYKSESRSSKDDEEIAFWRSLPGVELEREPL
jgi:hypothetical protein